MRTFASFAFAALRGVELPFPDVKDPAPEPVEEVAAPVVAAAPEPEVSDNVAPWSPPKAKEGDDFASSSDAFAHPSAAVVKDWETAPKVEIFDTPTMEPTPEISDHSWKEKKLVALPVVHSSLTPIVTSKQDEDPELASIQQDNPLAYGIVKALLLKKSMGLPLPGSEIQAHSSVNVADGATHMPAASDHISNMFNWKPSSTASDTDELAAAETMSSVSSVEPVEEPKEEPKVEEAKVEEPKVEEPKVEEPKVEEASAPASTEDKPPALGSWLGVSSPAAPKQTGGMSVMSSYMNDLN